jgi:hypothetical protein
VTTGVAKRQRNSGATMYLGAWKSAKGGSGHEFHVGPHLIVSVPIKTNFKDLIVTQRTGCPM